LDLRSIVSVLFQVGLGDPLERTTSHGFVDINGPQVTILDYRGIICP